MVDLPAPLPPPTQRTCRSLSLTPWLPSDRLAMRRAEPLTPFPISPPAARVPSPAVQRSVLVLRLPLVMAVHHRLMYDTENRLWHLVAEAMDTKWATAQAAAFGLEPSDDADSAALELFALAADEVVGLLTPAQAEVMELARRVARWGTG